MLNFKNISIVAVFAVSVVSAAGTLTVQCGQTGIRTSPLLYGLFFEELQHAGEGGLWGELVQNRTFDGSDRASWSLVRTGAAAGSIAYETGTPLHTAQPASCHLTVSAVSGTDRIGIANSGFWGMNIVSGSVYTLSFYARASSGYAGLLRATLESSNGATIYASQTITGLTTSWQKFTATLTPTGGAAQGRLAITSSATGSVWFDVVSLFPPTFKNRPNGLRRDLASMLDSIHPKFVRFPGGTYVEGATMAGAFRWKKTIGDPITRPGHNGNWGYWSTDGLGYLEYLQMAEDFGAEPLFVINCGMAHNSGAVVPLAQMGEYVQDALDAIEYANGDTATTTWGALRKAHGHPAPFNLKYIEIGNEAYFQIAYYRERYPLFYNAIHAAYPSINIISNAESWDLNNNPVDWVDHHNYYNPDWGWNNTDNYAGEPRTGRKIFLGEYMACDWVMPSWGLLLGAVSDGAYLTGLERNSDIVKMACAAPLLCNLSLKQWGPNCLYFNSSALFGSPQYYVQKMYSNNIGDVIVPTSFSIASPPLRFNASKVEATGEIIIKIVNVTATADPITISLAGLTALPSRGTAMVLASATADTNDGNSITQPTKVVPVTSNITNLGANFSYTVGAWSIHVLRLGFPTAVSGGTGETNIDKQKQFVSAVTMKKSGTGIALTYDANVALPMVIAVHSLNGEKIAGMVDGNAAAGVRTLLLNTFSEVGSGTYLVSFTVQKKSCSTICVMAKR